ncbi:heterokaryon incompatibility protein-domain-containing protein, partial [Fusarium solani]
MTRVHQWLSQCLTSHAGCESATSSWFPSRLIHVGDEKTSPSIRLRANVPTSAQYATLSHCWGQTPTFRLLQNNVAAFQTELPMNRMPRTYRDAIAVVKQLGWEYLWIDSLCILQDDGNDWHAECAEMHLIYKNGICNISASHAEDSEGGLFSERNPEYLEPPTVQTEWTNWANGHFVCINPQHMWGRGVSKSTLNTRGWVLQEHALSRRTIHFARDMVFWECPTKCASEAEPDGLMTKEAGRLPLAKLMIEKKEPLEIWAELLGRYTASSLTYEKDKLVAIAGVAKTIQDMSRKSSPSPNITYHAGLWSRFLAQQLLWQVPSNPSPAASKPKIYRAPSWSWASIDGEI